MAWSGIVYGGGSRLVMVMFVIEIGREHGMEHSIVDMLSFPVVMRYCWMHVEQRDQEHPCNYPAPQNGRCPWLSVGFHFHVHTPCPRLAHGFPKHQQSILELRGTGV